MHACRVLMPCSVEGPAHPPGGGSRTCASSGAVRRGGSVGEGGTVGEGVKCDCPHRAATGLPVVALPVKGARLRKVSSVNALAVPATVLPEVGLGRVVPLRSTEGAPEGSSWSRAEAVPALGGICQVRIEEQQVRWKCPSGVW